MKNRVPLCSAGSLFTLVCAAGQEKWSWSFHLGVPVHNGWESGLTSYNQGRSEIPLFGDLERKWHIAHCSILASQLKSDLLQCANELAGHTVAIL